MNEGFDCEGCVWFDRARIGGNVNFSGAVIRNGNGQAINADNAKIDGSFSFGGGFVAEGEVSIYGAEISKDLNYSGSIFYNPSGFAIKADGSSVSGDVLFEPEGEVAFQSVGVVSLVGANCGAMDCSAGLFSSPNSMDKPDSQALDCSSMSVKGDVRLRYNDSDQFEAHGLVKFYAAEIGGNFDCTGGRFINPKGVALDCQAAKIAGCVFLGKDYDDNDKERSYLAFDADGNVKFTGASIGLQFACQGGRFRNANPDPVNDNYAGTALDLSVATIKDTLFLGVEKLGKREPAKVEGRLDLTAANVRILVDDQFVGGSEKGLAPTVKANREGEDGKERFCHLVLDNFTYERLSGDDACDSRLRKKWLERQPPEHLNEKFRPQPFEQLVKVLRAMGHGKDADEIGLEKRWCAWKRKPWDAWNFEPEWSYLWRSLWAFLTKLGELVFVRWFLGYGYRIGRALVILILLGIGFAWFYQQAFEQCAIVASDKKIRDKLASTDCKHRSVSTSPEIVGLVPFKAWLYSADVIIPVVELGQKKAWQPANNVLIELPILERLETPNLVYYVQLTETALGWMGALLLVSFVGGLIKKD